MVPRRLVGALLLVAALVVGTSVVLSAPQFEKSNQIGDEDLVDVAGDLYGSDSEYEIYTFPQDEVVHAVFGDDYVPYRVVELNGHPVTVHTMIVDESESIVPENAFDGTRDFTELMGDAGILIGTEGDALEVAKAYGVVANRELQVNRTLVDSSDSDRLGYAVEDPTVTALLDGWEVEFSTWNATNGVLTNWTVTVGSTELGKAEWYVGDMGVGPQDRSWEASNFNSQQEVLNDFEGDDHALELQEWTGSSYVDLLNRSEVLDLNWTTVETNSTFDDSSWVVQSPEGSSAPSELVSALDRAGPWAYSKFVASSDAGCAAGDNPDSSWGLTARDADCTLEIRVLPDDALVCGACLKYESDAFVMYVMPDIQNWMEGTVGWYASGHPYGLVDTSRLAVGHQYLVHLTSETAQDLPEVSYAEPGALRRPNGTLAVGEFPLRAISTPMYDSVYNEFSDDPAFAVAPARNGSQFVHVIANSTSVDWNHSLVPRPWGVEVSEYEASLENTTVMPIPDGDGGFITAEDYDSPNTLPDDETQELSFVNPEAVEYPRLENWTRLLDTLPSKIPKEVADAANFGLQENDCQGLSTPALGEALGKLSEEVGVNNSLNESASLPDGLETHAARLTNCIAFHFDNATWKPETMPVPPSDRNLSRWWSIARDLRSEASEVPSNLSIPDGHQCLDENCWIQTGGPDGATYERSAFLIIDRGDSTYRNNSGGALGVRDRFTDTHELTDAIDGVCDPARVPRFPDYPPVSAVVDLQGDDKYVPRDSGVYCYPTLGGATHGGVGVVVDRNGSDYFEAVGGSMGFSAFGGAGYMEVREENTSTSNTFYSPWTNVTSTEGFREHRVKAVMGSGTAAVGVLYAEGLTNYTQHGVDSMGYSCCGGVGTLIDPHSPSSFHVYPNPMGQDLTNGSGVSMGSAESIAGGAAVLLNGGQPDGVTDEFVCHQKAIYGCIGTATSGQGMGALFYDEAGDSRYTVEAQHPDYQNGTFPVGVGAGHQAGAAAFFDVAGNDTYETPFDGKEWEWGWRDQGRSCGWGLFQGLALFRDSSGNDTYDCYKKPDILLKGDNHGDNSTWIDGITLGSSQPEYFGIGIGVDDEG